MASRSSKQYWAERALKREQESYLRGARLTAKTFADYQRAARDIRRQINDFYIRYARENRLTYEEAVRIMSRKELQEWRAGLGAYVERINAQTDPILKAKLIAELDALSYNSRISRLQALEAEINMTLNELFDRGVKQMEQEFGATLKEAYYKKVFDIQQRVGYQFEFALMNRGMIENIVSYPWSGANFSDRTWRNKDALLFNVREILTQGLIQGKSLPAMSQELADNMGQSFKNAERLIRTETAHFHGEADKKAYEAAGIKEYEFMATLDSITSDICASLDGKVFALSKAEEGVNYPPMHPNCRSTTIEHDPEDAQDWAESGLEMPKNKKYDDWYNEEVASRGEERFKQDQKRDRNIGQDQEQYERYKDVLGKDAPKTFADFQDMKYNNTERWNDTKGLYRYVNKHPESNRTFYEVDKYVKGLKAEGLVSVKMGAAVKPQPVQFDNIAEHAAKRLVERSITAEQARNYIANAKVAFYQAGGQKRGLLSSEGFAVVNVKLKKLETAYPANEFTEGMKKIIREVDRIVR